MREPLDDVIKALEYWGRVGKSLQDRFMPTISLTLKHIEFLHEQLKRHRERYQHVLDQNYFLREENRVLRRQLRELSETVGNTKQT